MVLETGDVGLGHLDKGLDGVGDVHHRQVGAGAQVAGIAAFADCAVEGVHGVVGGAAAGLHLPAHHAGQADTTDVQPHALEEVVAHQLAEHLGDAVERGGALQGLVGGVVVGRVNPEGGDGARYDHPLQTRVASSFQHVQQAVYVDPVGQRTVGFGGHGEQRAEVIEGVYAKVADGSLNGFLLGNVELG